MENLTEQQSLVILINAAKLAQQKGAFSLEEAEIIARAIRTFQKDQPVQQPAEPQGPVSTEG